MDSHEIEDTMLTSREMFLALFFTTCLGFSISTPVRGAELPFHGFTEGAFGIRLRDDSHQPRDAVLGEARLSLEKNLSVLEGFDFFGRVDFLGDLAREEDAEVLVREAYLSFSPFEFLDVKLGRQILTWGTGDLIFINDLFPKDFVSFFIGREDEFLKLPSDAARLSIFTDWINLDLVGIPVFRPDNAVTGERLSFFNPFTLSRAGEQSTLNIHRQARNLENAELALRAYKNIGSVEVAFYAFRGFFKQPAGVRGTAARQLFHPELAVWGGSVRGPVLGGIGNAEVGYYDSLEDRSGRDPNVENSSIRYLVGYSREAARNFTVGIQYNLEQILRYDKFLRSLPTGAPRRDEFRHLLTVRLTQLLLRETLNLSLFAFWSPSDGDYHIRPAISYKITDNLKVTAGANLFGGIEEHTFFGQLRDNTNAYLRFRHSF